MSNSEGRGLSNWVLMDSFHSAFPVFARVIITGSFLPSPVGLVIGRKSWN